MERLVLRRVQGAKLFWREEGKNLLKGGAAASFLGEGEERVKFFRVFLFCVASLLIAKSPLFWCVLKATIYRQNVAWTSKLVHQLSLFFL
jgi:hypothetical protein